MYVYINGMGYTKGNPIDRGTPHKKQTNKNNNNYCNMKYCSKQKYQKQVKIYLFTQCSR